MRVSPEFRLDCTKGEKGMEGRVRIINNKLKIKNSGISCPINHKLNHRIPFVQ